MGVGSQQWRLASSCRVLPHVPDVALQIYALPGILVRIGRGAIVSAGIASSVSQEP